jgi:hypothetical protein
LDAIAERCGREIANMVVELGLHQSFVWDIIERETLQDSPRLLKREVGWSDGLCTRRKDFSGNKPDVKAKSRVGKS